MFLSTATMAQADAEEKKADDQSAFEPTNESQTVLTEDNQALIEKIKEQYSSNLNAVESCFPHKLQQHVIGCGRRDVSESVTLERFETFLESFDSLNWANILDEPMQNEETMFKAWPLYIYGMIQ